MKTIVVKTSFEGIHCWPEAPAEVKYLRQLHRHIFNVVVEIEVKHMDRELEFIMVKHKLNEWLAEHFDSQGVWQMGRLSCEQVAWELVEKLSQQYGTRFIKVCVLEDGENGACIQW